MQEIDAIQNKRESKIISSINNDTSENGYIVFDYREKSGYRNFDTQDCSELEQNTLSSVCPVLATVVPQLHTFFVFLKNSKILKKIKSFEKFKNREKF